MPALTRWHLPAEHEHHQRTHMTWPTRRIWFQYTAEVRADIALLARTIAEHEPVSLLAEPKSVQGAQRACGEGVEVYAGRVDDLWARDTGPAFVEHGTERAGVDFNFNGWGRKQAHRGDRLVAREMLDRVGVRRVVAPIVAEGGAIEVDGEGTLMATESSLVNPNRNPGKTRDQIERVLKRLCGVRKVIWLEGLAGHDITDCHVDALARFAAPGVVVLSKPAPGTPAAWVRVYEQARRVLGDATDARGRRLDLVDLPEAAPPRGVGRNWLGCYANYYVANGAVVVPRFGVPPADRRARDVIADLYPRREVVSVPIPMIAEGGGGIHCATQQQPA